MVSYVRSKPAKHLWSLAVVMFIIVGCRDDGSTTPAVATSSSAAPRATDARAQGLCDRLAVIEIGRAAGATAEFEPGASGASVCTYRIGSGAAESHHIAVRIEDSFQSVDQVETAFPDGVVVGNVGDRAYWASAVATLWFSQSALLYAVQVVGLESDETGQNRAVAVAEVVVKHL